MGMSAICWQFGRVVGWFFHSSYVCVWNTTIVDLVAWVLCLDLTIIYMSANMDTNDLVDGPKIGVSATI